MSIKIDSKYKQKRGVVFEEIDGRVHILDENQDAIISLNTTATFLWKSLSKPTTLRELTKRMMAEYSIDEKHARDDTKEVLVKLEKLALISVT